MQKRNLGLTGAALVLGVAVLVAAPTTPTQRPQIFVGYRPLPAADAIGMGLSLEPFTGRLGPSITAAEAMAVARSRVGAMVDAADSATVSLGIFTDQQYVDIEPSGTHHQVIDHKLCYLVTLYGLELQGHGHGYATNTTLTIVVDAMTGKVLEEYSNS